MQRQWASPNKKADERRWKHKALCRLQTTYPNDKDWMFELVQYLLKSGNDGKDFYNTAGSKVHPAFVHTTTERSRQRMWTDKLLMGLIKYKERFEDETIFALVLHPESVPGLVPNMDNIFKSLLENIPRGFSTNPAFISLVEDFKAQFARLLIDYQQGFCARSGVPPHVESEDFSESDSGSIPAPLSRQSGSNSHNPTQHFTMPTPLDVNLSSLDINSTEEPSVPPYTPFPDYSSPINEASVVCTSPFSRKSKTPPINDDLPALESPEVNRRTSPPFTFTSNSPTKMVSVLWHDWSPEAQEEIQQLNEDIERNSVLLQLIMEDDDPSD